MMVVPARELAAALAALNEIIDGRTTLPFPAHVTLFGPGDTLTVSGTDLDQILTIDLPCLGGDVQATVKCDVLLKIVRQRQPDGDIGFAMNEHGLVVDAGSNFTLRSLDAGEFPILGGPPVDPAIELNAEDVASVLTFLLLAVEPEGTRFPLNGVLMHRDGDDLVFVATDAHRMCWARLPAPAGSEELARPILHRNAVKAILRAIADTGAPVRFSFGLEERTAGIRVGNRTLVTKLIDMTFPNYRTLIPTKLVGSFAVPAGQIVELVRMAEALGPEGAKTLRVEPFEDRVTYVGRDGKMTGRMLGRCEGAVPKLFGVRADWLRAFAEHDDGELILRFTDNPEGPILIQKADTRLSGMLMPTRID